MQSASLRLANTDYRVFPPTPDRMYLMWNLTGIPMVSHRLSISKPQYIAQAPNFMLIYPWWCFYLKYPPIIPSNT